MLMGSRAARQPTPCIATKIALGEQHRRNNFICCKREAKCYIDWMVGVEAVEAVMLAHDVKSNSSVM